MTGPVKVAGYWGPRREPLAACAARAERFLAALAELDPLLGRWYRKGRSPKPEGQPVGLDRETLAALLAAGRNRRDFGGEAIEELGWGLDLWNGAEPAASLSITCGAWAPTSPNVVLVSLAGGDLGRFGVGGLRALVDAWEPDDASCFSADLRDVQDEAGLGAPWVGWITYVRCEGEPDLTLPPGARLERWPNGIAVTLGLPPEPITERDLLAVRHALTPLAR